MRARTVVLKLRYANFRRITRQQSLPEPTDDAEEIAERALVLLGGTAQEEDKFRLIGVSCTNLVEPEKTQLELWEETVTDEAEPAGSG
jgi:DNA polymerase-4